MIATLLDCTIVHTRIYVHCTRGIAACLQERRAAKRSEFDGSAPTSTALQTVDDLAPTLASVFAAALARSRMILILSIRPLALSSTRNHRFRKLTKISTMSTSSTIQFGPEIELYILHLTVDLMLLCSNFNSPSRPLLYLKICIEA